MRLPALGLAIALALGVTTTALAWHDSASLYTVDLETGVATEVGPIGTYSELIGLAAEVDGATLLYGVSTTGQLVAFDFTPAGDAYLVANAS